MDPVPFLTVQYRDKEYKVRLIGVPGDVCMPHYIRKEQKINAKKLRRAQHNHLGDIFKFDKDYTSKAFDTRRKVKDAREWLNRGRSGYAKAYRPCQPKWARSSDISYDGDLSYATQGAVAVRAVKAPRRWM
jgi:hypothetical protein